MKTLFFDVETTGVDSRQNAMIQFAGIVDFDGEVKAEYELKIKPFPEAKIDDSALKIRNIDRSVFDSVDYLDERDAYHDLTAWFGLYVSKFDKFDKMIPVAYNGNFDMDFLSELWSRQVDSFLGSWLDRGKMVDPLRVVSWLNYTGKLDKRLLNFKLATVCNAFGITEEKATHDALDDVRALRALTLKLKNS